MHHVKDAPPAGEFRETFGEIRFVSESIIHARLGTDLSDLLHIGGRWARK